jgi:metal-responsive CopG/Arc/MetJ family transcriptional regulator
MALDIDGMGEKKDQRIPVMMSAEEVEAIDAWRRKQDDIPSRSEAIRRLVDASLRKAKSKP